MQPFILISTVMHFCFDYYTNGFNLRSVEWLCIMSTLINNRKPNGNFDTKWLCHLLRHHGVTVNLPEHPVNLKSGNIWQIFSVVGFGRLCWWTLTLKPFESYLSSALHWVRALCASELFTRCHRESRIIIAVIQFSSVQFSSFLMC